MVLRIAWVALLLMLTALVCGQDVGIVKEIQVQGNVRVTKEAILSNMSTKVGSVYSEAKLQTDREALLGLGFFSAVDVRGVPVESGNNWQVIVTVQEFPTIKEIAIHGNSVVTREEILKVISPHLLSGNIYDPRYRDQSGAAIEKLYLDKGYFGRVLNIAPLAESPQTLDITVVEDKVGTISVQGNKLTKDWVMKRLVKMRSGELLSQRRVQNDTRRILNTGWFESARFVPEPETELGYRDLTIDLKEQATGTFNVGVQIDPQSSIAGVLRYSQANIGGTGQTIGVNFLQATTGGGPSIDVNYTNPFFGKNDTTLQASVYSRVLYRFSGNLFGGGTGFINNQAYDERHTGFSVGLSRALNDYVSVGSSLRLERVSTENLNNLFSNNQTPNDPTDDQTTNSFIQQDGSVFIWTLGGTRNRRDIDIDPSRGDYLQVTVEPGYTDITHVGGLTTNTDVLGPHYFARGTVDYRMYWSPWQKPRGLDLNDPRKVIAVRVRYGGITGTVPFFEQYFAGGPDTVRGYPPDRFWGKDTLLMNLELRYPLQKAFSLIGFVDYGGAWGGYGTIQGYTQSSKFDLHLGYGPGVSFRTPLGNIQLFLGFNQQGGTQTHFLIGNSF